MKIIRTATLALFVVAVLATPEDELIAEARRFTATLYQELIKSRPNQNVVFSAISVQTLMGLLASGSSNENDEAIREIVVGTNLPYGDANRQNAFKEVLKSLNTKDDDFNVIDATKIYIPKRYRIQNWYQHIAKSVYGTEIEAINFNNPENASQIMNHWVETKTNNTIKNLVKSGDLEDADMVLINTLYLNGNWMIQFSPERNIIKSFYSPNGIQQVTMMINEYQKQRYAEDNHAQYLSLEIASSFDRDGVAEMVFVLPKQKQPLSTLENNVYDLFRPVTFNECFVNVTLPKFSFSSDIPLIVPLKSIGIRKIFGYPGAKFDGLTPDVGAPYIRITNALQKASIDVNEMGVAASVATAYPYTPDAPACYKVFNADRPFLFYISVDDVILFAGRVMQI